MGASASRTKFRESVDALTEMDVSPEDADFWDELWKIPSSADEVFELITPESARRLRDERFDNLSTLFTQATAQLCQIVETPYNIYFDQALNCVRVLTRILPFLLEKGDLDENVEQLCWGTVAVDDNRTTGSQSFRSDNDGDADDEDSLVTGTRTGTETDDVNSDVGKTDDDESDGSDNSKEEEQEPLALLVVHAAMHMLFLPQFTCDYYEDDGDYDQQEFEEEDNLTPAQIAKKRRDKEKMLQKDREMRAEAGLATSKLVDRGVSIKPRPAGIVWAPGVCIARNFVGTRKYDKNRVEVLRLLLAACCEPLFSAADEYNPLASRWMSVAVAADAPNAICLFYSLLNTIMTYDPNGIGVPYSGLSSEHVKLVELSVQALCVLLDSGTPGSPESVVSTSGDPIVEYSEASKNGFNIFRLLLARIDSGRDLEFCYQGFVRLLSNVYLAKNTLLPHSVANLECFQELMVLLWKMLEENPLFMQHILTNDGCDVNELVIPVCFLMYSSRKDPANIGLVHICTFVLLKLSGERSFGVSLNKPFHTKLPCDMPLFTGSHTDLLCITLHKLIVNGAYKLVPLYSCFLTVICNVSPYWRSMSLVAAVKLVNLFELFSSPKFLYSGENAHRHLALLLEAFNNVIQYQYTGNQHLVYAVVRRKDSFGRLASLNLVKAQTQCDKVYGGNETVQYDADAEDKLLQEQEEAAVKSDEKEGRNDTNESDVKQPDENADQPNDGDEDSRSSVSSTTTGTATKATREPSTSILSSATGEQFRPTERWLAELKASLPLETVTRLLQHVIPVVDDLCLRKNGVVDEVDILEVLKDITMVGLLPVPHAIVIRKYQPNQYTALWFTAFMWGVIFLRNQKPPVFDGQHVELFQVSVTTPSNPNAGVGVGTNGDADGVTAE